MSDGTYLMNVFVPRVHRHNADSVRKDAADMLNHYRDALMVIAAAPGPCGADEQNEVAQRAADIYEGIRDEAVREYLASCIVSNPGDVLDELCPEDESKELWGVTE